MLPLTLDVIASGLHHVLMLHPHTMVTSATFFHPYCPMKQCNQKDEGLAILSHALLLLTSDLQFWCRLSWPPLPLLSPAIDYITVAITSCHCHGWVTPPIDFAISVNMTFCSNLLFCWNCCFLFNTTIEIGHPCPCHHLPLTAII